MLRHFQYHSYTHLSVKNKRTSWLEKQEETERNNMVSTRTHRLPPPPPDTPPTSMAKSVPPATEGDKENVDTTAKTKIAESSNTPVASRRKPLQALPPDSNTTSAQEGETSQSSEQDCAKRQSSASAHRETLLQRAEESGPYCPQAWVDLIHYDWEQARKSENPSQWEVVAETVQACMESVQEPYKTDAAWVRCLLYNTRVRK